MRPVSKHASWFLLCGVAVLMVCNEGLAFQLPRANELLAHALHLADLYNWADAAPSFTEAEKLFESANDKRNALYARLGRIRSNVERDQEALPSTSADLSEALEDDPLLQSDRELRMFCFIVKGDIDTETNTGAMERDWKEVQRLARDLGNEKWQYRALAQLGIAAFYNADIETARNDVGVALEAAAKAGDIAAQVRFLSILANALIHTKAYAQALAYTDNAMQLATKIPDAGYQFTIQDLRVHALIGLNRLDDAQQAANELLRRAREARRTSHEAAAWGLFGEIAAARNNREEALTAFRQAIDLDRAAGLTRQLADAYARTAEIYRQIGDHKAEEQFAELAAAATQASGDLWAVPQRLMTVAELEVAQHRYTDADRSYDRAEAFIDSLVGQASTVLDKTAVIRASSQIYTRHFALVAEQLNNPTKAYSIIEHVRGRVAADLLAAGSAARPEQKNTERAISELRLKLVAARSTDEVRRLRDEIFIAEQARWLSPGISILKAKSDEVIGIEQVRSSLPVSAVVLEYVITDPKAYCLSISRTGVHITRIDGKARIDALVSAYVKAVKAKLPAVSESRSLYDALIRPVADAEQKDVLIVVRDGQLNLVPFDALREPSGRYVVENRTVIYSPSATTFYRLSDPSAQSLRPRKALLAVGGVPYSRSVMNRSVLTRGYDQKGFADLPASDDEVRIAQSAFANDEDTLLLGNAATESAFKRLPLEDYRVIHLAVHGFADPIFPDRAALVLLSDRSAGEDGFMQSSEVAQMRLNADLVVLSACDTAVGALEGQEGIATLSRAFFLAGARTVISSLWQVDDSSALFLMRRFYAHLAGHYSPAFALTYAKRDMLNTFGRRAVPFEWAAFVTEGPIGNAIFLNKAKVR